MAKMYPERMPQSVLQDPSRAGECYVYEKLSTLTGDYTVFYSINWTSFDNTRPFIEGEADFIIVHPNYGVMVLEVKGGTISYNSDEDQWYTTTRGGNIYKIKDPVLQGNRSRRDLMDRVKQFSQWSRNFSLNICNAVCFPDTYVGGNSLRADLDRAILVDRRDLDEALEEKIRGIFNLFFARNMAAGAPGPRGVADLTFMLARSFELSTPLGIDLEYDDRKLIELTEAQMNTLSFLGARKRVAISGCAGSGKTMLAVEKAIRMKRQGLEVLVTCYNKYLADDLRKRLEQEEIAVAHFHKLATEIAKEYGFDMAVPQNDQKYYDEFLPNTMFEQLVENGPIYDAIVVDEGQDFKEAYWIALSVALKPEGYLYIFFDNNQNIYSSTGQFVGLIEESPFVLTENCRNTQSIHRLVKNFYHLPLQLSTRGPGGREPEVIRYSSEADQAQKLQQLLYRLVNTDRIEPKNIVILTPRSQDTTSLKAGRKLGNFVLTSEQGKRPVSIQVSSIHQFKGLERQVVIMAEIDERYNYNPDMVMYVGASRARAHLVLFVDDKAPKSILEKIDPIRGMYDTVSGTHPI